MAITVGQSAPDFSLFSDEKKAVTLSKELGKPVVLLFFPAAFTGTCTTELNTVSNDLGSFGSDTAVFGISTDSPFTLTEYRSVNALQFPLLSDHDADVCALYGTKYHADFTPMKLDRIAKRAAFVIDRKGVVRFAQVLENAGELPDLERVREIVSGL